MIVPFFKIEITADELSRADSMMREELISYVPNPSVADTLKVPVLGENVIPAGPRGLRLSTYGILAKQSKADVSGKLICTG
jgi:hypothetical protein